MMWEGEVVRMGGGVTHGHIRLRACTLDISDSEPYKLGSLPESLDKADSERFFLHTIILKTKIFFQPIFDHNYLCLYV